MAKIDLIIPSFLKWETGNSMKKSETLEQYYNRCKASKGGVSEDPDDTGGFTVCGITYETYRTYCKVNRKADPTKEQMRAQLTYAVWYDVLKTRFWDKCQGDNIKSQSVAHIVVDWFWGSGFAGLKSLQKCLSLTADGIVGPKTLATLNGANAKGIFDHIKDARVKYYNSIVEKRPTNKKFLKGWMNRLNDIQFVG